MLGGGPGRPFIDGAGEDIFLGGPIEGAGEAFRLIVGGAPPLKLGLPPGGALGLPGRPPGGGALGFPGSPTGAEFGGGA